MEKRTLIKQLIAGKPVERCGFWLGNPHPDTWPVLHKYFGTRTEEELRLKLHDDCRWICPQFYPDVYQDPKGGELFDATVDRDDYTTGPLGDCETVADLEKYPWPSAEYLNFDSCKKTLENAGDVYRLSGMWTCFYHNLADLFGMEEYLVKMHTNPEVLLAATDKIGEFYYDANEKFFNEVGDLVDGFFFGNDFGTQVSLICGPEQFDMFVMPWFRRFTEQGHKHGLQVVLHSCGSIFDVIERLIDSGVDCLHPIQAKAANMEAERLAKEFKGRITFMGGIDTQELIAFGTPEQVRADVERVRGLLGPNLIISPSHEAILPNVPPENVEALAQAAIPFA